MLIAATVFNSIGLSSEEDVADVSIVGMFLLIWVTFPEFVGPCPIPEKNEPIPQQSTKGVKP